VAQKIAANLKIQVDELRDGLLYRRCPECGELKEINEFGLRRFKEAGPEGQDVIRNQSWCRDCRRPE